jgi:hypothetical protein
LQLCIAAADGMGMFLGASIDEAASCFEQRLVEEFIRGTHSGMLVCHSDVLPFHDM